MAGKNWQAGGGITSPARVVACFLAAIVPSGACAAVSDFGLVKHLDAALAEIWVTVLSCVPAGPLFF